MLAHLDDLEDEQYDPEITLAVSGLTCQCPFNGRTDTFSVEVAYVPMRGRVLELAAFRRYLDSFAGQAVAHESLTRRLLEDVLDTIAPAICRVETVWEPIEGVGCIVRVAAGT